MSNESTLVEPNNAGAANDVEESHNFSEKSGAGNESEFKCDNKDSGISLLKLIKKKNLDDKNIVQEWIDYYFTNPQAALVIFMQFVVDASGCGYKIPVDTKFPFAFDEILTSAELQFNGGPKYPLVNKYGHTLAQNVGNFVEILLKAADNTCIVFDDVFLSNITSFVMVCSESKVRAFRHTSTLIGVKMLTTLNDLQAVEYSQLEALWLAMFGQVFLPRCTDVVDDIRVICITECGNWLYKYPQCFLQGRHMEHLFAALQDNAAKVRECGLQALLTLFGNTELKSACVEYGNKFGQVIIALSVDKEDEVAELAVKLLVSFYKISPDSISESMYTVTDALVLAAHRGLATAAAELLYLRYFKLDEDQRPGQQQFSSLMRHLLKFFIEFGEHEHAAYFVDALYDNNTIVLDWENMVLMLLEEQSPLSGPEVSALIDIMTCGVKQAVTGEVPPGRYTKDLVRRPKPQGQHLALQCFGPSLPALIRKYRSSGRIEDLINLTELPQFMDLVAYMDESWRQQLQELLYLLAEIMFTHEDITLLKMVAKTLESVFKARETLPSHVEAIRNELLNKAVTNYMLADNSIQDAIRVEISAGQIQSLCVTLRTLSALYAYFDLSAWELSWSLFANLQRATKSRGDRESQLFPTEARDLYFEICYLSLNWDLKRLMDAVAVIDADIGEDCANLKDNLEAFLFVAFNLIQYAENSAIAHQAVGFACDLFVLFADQLRQSSNASIRTLQYMSSINEHELLENFVLRHVFTGAPDQILEERCFAEWHSNRHVVASYCKLVAYNVMPMMRASVIFQYYDQFYEAYGDILRAALEITLTINPVSYGMTLLHTCILVYKRITATSGNSAGAVQSPEFCALLKLAKRLAETFQNQMIKGRAAVVTLHRAGIMYASELVPEDPTGAPENLSFLSVVQVFSPHLLAQDKKEMLTFLERIEQPSLPSCRAHDWDALEAYRLSLKTNARLTASFTERASEEFAM